MNVNNLNLCIPVYLYEDCSCTIHSPVHSFIFRYIYIIYLYVHTFEYDDNTLYPNKANFPLFLHRVAGPQDSLLCKRRVGPNKVWLFPIHTQVYVR